MFNNYFSSDIPQSYYSPQNPSSFNNQNYEYWMRALYQRLLSVFEWDNLPKDWTNDSNIVNSLFCWLIRYGFVVVSEDNEFGLWFQPCTLKGRNLYRQPTEAVVSNSLFKKSKSIKLSGANKTGTLLQLTDDYRGLFDILSYYAERLAILDGTTNVSLITARTPYFIWGKTKTAMQALKYYLDRLFGGEPAVIAQREKDDFKGFGDEGNIKGTAPFEQTKLFSKTDYITDQLLIDRQKILDAFDNEIGIPTANTEKKSIQTIAEVTSKQYDSCARANSWLENLQRSIENINKMFGTNISVKLRINKEVLTHGNEANSVWYGTVPSEKE